jgi:glycosyltransferase involved in cell wall biosynthesis
VITELDVGGAERCLTRLVTGISKTRFEPYVFSLWQRPARGEDSLVQEIESAGIPVRFLNARSVLQAWNSRNTLKRAFQELRVDIVQNFLFRANVLGTSAARAAGVSGILLGIRVADPSRWRMRLENRAARQADRVVCVSDSVAEFAKSHWTCGSEKLTVIANGVDLERYPAAHPADLNSLGIPAGRRALIAIGRLHRQKGFDWLLQLAPDLLRTLPQHDLLIVGDGEERATLTQQASAARLADRVHFVGHRSDVPALLAASDALLLPSRWEGMPNVLLEAMASQLPVVATRAEGVEQVLGDVATEQTVSFGASAEFIEAVSRVVLRGAELGEKNRRRVERDFSLATMIERYEEFYASLVGC